MRIAVLGANGNVGSRTVAEALARGHSVTAVVRGRDRAGNVPEGVTVQVADVRDADAVAQLAREHDVLIAATRPAAGSEEGHAAMTDGILTGLAGSDARLLMVGGAASLVVPGSDGTLVLDDPRFVPPAIRPIAQASLDQYQRCDAAGDVDWSYLCPPALLEPGERTGHYRLGGEELLVDSAGRSAISMEDFAIALVDEAEEARHRRARFTVAY
ncbi:NAD(P)-dependent oxidoreductase [uncultured Nitratireductor sp.]|uniref:NAD(P)-dependent oxidoreductase n=1 Tax=uncultured Nitratireductor sp. TaxID=520953 RepID=UPI0025F3FA48|nr:NAD(P)H-binding protein [uncultured Nitratireductor sp.]